MTLLFNINIPAINKHIRNIISENELDASSTISKIEIVRYEGNRRVKGVDLIEVSNGKKHMK